VALGQFIHGLAAGEIPGHIFTPAFGLLEKSVFIHFVLSSTYFKNRHIHLAVTFLNDPILGRPL
jgi:hypothetical protein